MKEINFNIDCRIIRKIADGGMGSVYEALQCGAVGFEKRVALKVLLPRFEKNNLYQEMFINEARLVASLVHENIVQLYHLGMDHDSYVMVMEYIHGYSLDQFIDHHRKLHQSIPEELAIFIASRIARGLAYAHAKRDKDGHVISVVHRDVSPRNILVTSEGLPKLADFGLAMVLPGIDAKAAQKYRAGKLSYMAPEQAKGIEVDRRTDIFSLGAVLFELLTLSPIRNMIRKKDQLHQALEEAETGTVNWNQLKSGNRICDILKKCLSVDPGHRYHDTRALAEELELAIYEKGYGPTIATLKDYTEKIGILF